MFSLICASTNGWANNCHAGDLRRHRAHYDLIVMRFRYFAPDPSPEISNSIQSVIVSTVHTSDSTIMICGIQPWWFTYFTSWRWLSSHMWRIFEFGHYNLARSFTLKFTLKEPESESRCSDVSKFNSWKRWWEGTNLSLSLLKQGHLNYPLIAQMAVSSVCSWALESVVNNRQMVDASSEPWQCSSLGWFQIYEIIYFQAEACRWSRKWTAKSMYCHIIKAPWIQANWCETSFDCGYLKFDYFIHFLYCGQVWATMMFAVARPIEQFDRNPNLMKFVITVV